MAISLSDIKVGKNNKPPRILIYGVAGIGKTTLCSNAPNPIFIQTEDGLGNIECPSFPLALSYNDVIESLHVLASGGHSYSTLVVDSLDWLEPLIHKKVCEDRNVNSIEEIPYGKGYVMALDYWRDYLDGLNYLRDNKNMMIMQTAHSDIKRFESPETSSYDRYVLKLHTKATALVEEHSDCVMFANYKTHTVEEDIGFNQKRTRAVGGTQRLLFTQERPAYYAKNRYNFPESIVLDDNSWGVISENISWFDLFKSKTPAPTPEGKK